MPNSTINKSAKKLTPSQQRRVTSRAALFSLKVENSPNESFKYEQESENEHKFDTDTDTDIMCAKVSYGQFE